MNTGMPKLMSSDPRIPQANPLAGYLNHKDEIDAVIEHVLSRGHYILGEEVAALEEEFSTYIGVQHGIGVGSGTEALHLALRCCGIGPGDEVVTVSHTAVATVAAIELCGTTPVLIDIDPTSFCMAPGKIESALTPRTKAVLPVHLYGHPVEMDTLTQVARAHGLLVVEDCAQSHGAMYAGKKTGSWGDIAAFSFYPTKNLGAIGDGGMVVTNDSVLAKRARELREYGWRRRYISDICGWNTRLDEIQAAVLRVKLLHLDEDNSKRIQLARLYGDLLSGTSLRLPRTDPSAFHVYHQYVVQSPQRELLRQHLNAHGVSTNIHYPVPIHLQPAYVDRIAGRSELHNTEKAAGEILSLPMFPELTRDQVRYVASTIGEWDQDGRKTVTA